MLRLLFSIAVLLCCFSLMAQQNISANDSSKVLDEIVVQAYQANRSLQEVPASVGVVKEQDLERFNATSLLPAMNTIPGVRMEERSPGSYRLSMRGSSIRSPFGVRNVKVYWNGLPFTDAGGNTYLNLFDFNSIQQAEIIKGPGSSLYGAGTGGVLLLKNNVQSRSGAEAGFSAGSFGLLRNNAAAHLRSKISSTTIRYAHQQADGYREHSEMERDIVQGQSDFYINNKNTLSVNLLYADLNYQTPGGLTKQQFEDDPQQARPSGATPGAIQQQAAVYNKTFFAGANHEYEWNNKWSTQTGIYTSHTDFINPTIRTTSYEERQETGVGGRTNTTFSFAKGKLNFGAEFQHGFSPIQNYGNNRGEKGMLLTDDELTFNTFFLFAQAELFLPWDLSLSLGGSVNKLKVDFVKWPDNINTEEAARNFDAIFSPRVALLKKINASLSVFASYSSGYSAPTIQEIYPSTDTFNQQLDPEHGNSFEIGMHGNFFHKIFFVEFTAYDFRLKDAIVRRNQGDAEYFVNAGGTVQRGTELQVAWSPKISASSTFRLWSSYTLNAYTFDDYTVDQDYSGNALTGTARNILVSGADFAAPSGIYANITYTFTDRIPLNDGNTEYADAYHLLGGKVGLRNVSEKFSLDIFLGVDNALNQQYSLGNDLNADRGRYYNAAPTINFYSGIKMSFIH